MTSPTEYGWWPVLLALNASLLVGCGGKPTDPKNDEEKTAAADLKLFGVGYQAHQDNNSYPPQGLNDLKKVIESDRPIDFARYHITWGVDLKVAAQDRTVLAYDVAAPEKGGMVLFLDGKVERVTAEEFQKLPRATPPKPIIERTADATFTPAEYHAEFKKLGEGMGRQYRGKVVELKGVVSGFGQLTYDGKPFIIRVSSPGTDHEDVRCFLSGGSEPWLRASKGQQVTVKGFVREPQANPMLSGCEFATTGPSTAVTTTAEELAKEFAASDEKATAKYRGKSFVLTGEVISAEKRGSSSLAVQLKGTADRPIECLVNSRDTADKKLVPGAKVKMYAEYGTSGSREVFLRLDECELISE